jgi:hypothetical protein
MKIFETNETVIAVVSAVGHFVIGYTMPTSINAQEMNAETEVDIIPPGEPKDITKTTNLTRQLQKKCGIIFRPKKAML